MDPLDMDELTTPLPPVRPIDRWPLYVVIGLSSAAILAVIILQSFAAALITYGVLLVAGCGLLFLQRRRVILATRQAGGIGYVALNAWDRIALGILVGACLANGLIIAFEMASWDWGF